MRRWPAHQDRRESAHPQSLHTTRTFCPGGLVELYDPDRSRSVTLRQGEDVQEKSWEEFAAMCQARFHRLHEAGGAGFRVLAEAHSSPTLAALQSRLLKAFPQAKWFEFEPTGDDNEPQAQPWRCGRGQN